MISDEYKALCNKYNTQGETRYIEGATEAQISSFEQECGVTLPDKYKEWLRFSDGGYLFLPAGIQFYGVAHKPLITKGQNDISNYIEIGALCTGDPILCEKTGERISIYNHEAGRIEPNETYPDFLAFIEDLNDILGLED